MLTLILSLYIVEGQSMQPQYQDKQMVETIEAPCKLGDTIAFTYQGENYIKYIVDRLSDGSIYVIGRPDKWIDPETKKLRQSLDSRTEWGYLEANEYETLGCVVTN